MIDKLKATVLVDNVSANGLKGEWGLSVYIEDGAHNILLDVGASKLFARNARALGLSIPEVDYAVLSHAHSDHANGMKEFFELNRKANFYVTDATAENCYFKYWIFHRYIGIPKRIMTKYLDRFSFAKGDYTLCEDVYLIPHHTEGLGKLGRRERMYQKNGRRWKADDFDHEQSLVFDTAKGLVIFNSCSHGGAYNIIREVQAVFPERKVYGLIGGFHLYNKSDEEVRELAELIRSTGIEYICTGHCTKEHAYEILKEELGDTAHMLHCGMVMEF